MVSSARRLRHPGAVSHLFAAIVPPLAVATLWRAGQERFDKHARLARCTLPIWLYVSVSGVLVYLMLYQMKKPRRPAL